jgi:hypothetical protein
MSQTTTFKLKVTPKGSTNATLYRGYSAIERKIANRKAGELVRSGDFASVEVVSFRGARL